LRKWGIFIWQIAAVSLSTFSGRYFLAGLAIFTVYEETIQILWASSRYIPGGILYLRSDHFLDHF
jgi:hypothetical protein